MRIPEDEKIRLAFEKRAFHAEDPEFRKDEVWQKIQMRLESQKNHFPNKYTLGALILLFFTLAGWMITFYQYSKLEKRNIAIFYSDQKAGKDNLKTALHEKVTKPVSKKEIFHYQKISSKSFEKVRKEEVSKHDNNGDTLTETLQNVTIAELIPAETQKITLLNNGNDFQIQENQESFTFSYKKNHRPQVPRMDARKIKVQLFIHETEEMNSQEMRLAELYK
jgi:hypothetical protein